jgi:IS605 OrfB family transposase
MLPKKFKSLSETFTFQTRVSLDASQELILDEYAKHMCCVEKMLFADFSKGKKLDSCKADYLKQFQITARQFNSVKAQLEGKISSIKERMSGLIAESKRRIEDLEKSIKKLEKRKAAPKVIHQKKRRLYNCKKKLEKKNKDFESGKVRLCFGTKELFHKQFYLQKNGYASQDEWKKEWQEKRSNSFFLIGSKDETSGNQSCTATLQEDGTLILRLRLPDCLAEKHGKYLIISNVQFSYGHDVIIANLKNCELRSSLQRTRNKNHKDFGVAISYRFLKDKKGYRVFVSTQVSEPTWITRKDRGIIGIDINVDHIAVVETDRFGNPIKHKCFPLVCYGKTTEQAKALIGDVTAEIVEWAKATQKPLILEKLDFQKKKAQLKELGFAKYSRMLSSFAYQTIISSIKSRAYRNRVKVEEVNPAFTSVIGRVKFAKRYGLSIHESAALCIGRRYLDFSESLPCHSEAIPDGKGGHVAFSLPARNRDQHVWSSWRKVQRRTPAALAAHLLAKKRSSSRSPPACCDR